MLKSRKERLFVFFILANAMFLMPRNLFAQSILKKVTYQFDWNIPTFYAGQLVALEKGFYRDEGLDVSFQKGDTSLVNMQLIGMKKVLMGSGQAPAVIRARLAGIPVVSVAVLMQTRGDVIMSLAENNIKTAQDLIGKRVGVVAGTILEDMFKMLMMKAGVPEESVEVVKTVSGAPLLIANNIDACTAATYSSWPMAVEKAGKQSQLIYTRDYGFDWYGSSVVVHEDLIKDDPELIRKFVRATLKGWGYIFDHRPETVDILKKHYPESDPEFLQKSLEAMMLLVESDDTKKNGLGSQNQEGWRNMQEDLFAIKSINQKLDPEVFFTTQFLPDHE